jgi:isoamylase
VNFITCHDGFTLADLVTYNAKHNEANGENNNDGANDNHSWNCGWEGACADPAVLALRQRQIRNAVAMLMVSQGTPMILMGDEVARSQSGNNNAYCHDTELNWLDWGLRERNGGLFRFVKTCIAFRRAHPVLRGNRHFSNRDLVGSGRPDISWHGTQAWCADWAGAVLAFMLCGRHARGGTVQDNSIYVAMNMHWETLPCQLPQPPGGTRWHIFANTSMPSPEDIWEPGREPALDGPQVLVGGRSVLILLAR